MSGKYVIADSALKRLAVSGGTIKQELPHMDERLSQLRQFYSTL